MSTAAMSSPSTSKLKTSRKIFDPGLMTPASNRVRCISAFRSGLEPHGNDALSHGVPSSLTICRHEWTACAPVVFRVRIRVLRCWDSQELSSSRKQIWGHRTNPRAALRRRATRATVGSAANQAPVRKQKASIDVLCRDVGISEASHGGLSPTITI